MSNKQQRPPGRTLPDIMIVLTISIIIGSLIVTTLVRRRQATPIAPSQAAIKRLVAHTPPGMILVPGGYCLLGSDDPDADDDVKPMRRVFLPSYYMDTHEVTNADYQKFDATHEFLPGQGDLPVTNVTYDQAAAYARWAGKRLPTDEEWEKAARGTDGRRYPWGDTWDPHRVAPRAHRPTDPASIAKPRTLSSSRFVSCNLGPPRVQRVGSVSAGVSPYGCYDMAGNAWEWVQGYFNNNPAQRILRGGAVGYGERACRTYTRAVEGSGDT